MRSVARKAVVAVTSAHTRLRAYCGDPEARESTPWIHCDLDESVTVSDEGTLLVPHKLADWITGLIPLIVADAVRECESYHEVQLADLCQRCNGTFKITDEDAVLRVCLAVAWECLDAQDAQDAPDLGGRIKKALDACQAYLADPTYERRYAWEKYWLQCSENWVPGPSCSNGRLALGLNAAAKALGARSIAVVLEAVRVRP